MAILSDGSIRKMVADRSLGIEPFYENGIQPATYDMRLYWNVLVSPTRFESGRLVDLRQEPNRTFYVVPGRFVGVLSEEILTFPATVAARFGLRSEFTRHGLIAFGGIQIDPGFHGRLALSLFHAGPEPIALELEKQFFTVEFQLLDAPALVPYKGDFQNQEEFPDVQTHFILNAHTLSMSEIASLPTEVSSLERRFVLHEATHSAPSPMSVADLALAMGVTPFSKVEDLAGGWPDDEDLDDFLKAVQTWRSQ
jgi:dCTP deaminase